MLSSNERLFGVVDLGVLSLPEALGVAVLLRNLLAGARARVVGSTDDDATFASSDLMLSINCGP